ncbi:hypothetical protein J4456_01300 [Candidatus Pacearchaeota archaeon]|nr:hypothetical protein [Candidatus Pacearchaeota archaeon]
MIIVTSTINEALKKIKESKKRGERVIVKAQDSDYNRKIVENKDVDIIVDLEFHTRKDSMKQRDSGLNEVLANLAKENNIAVGINVEDLKKLGKKEKARVIARMMQNILLCRKSGCKMILFPENKFNKIDGMSFLQALGSDTKMAKKAVSE